MRSHTLNTSTDTNLNHTRPNSIGNISNSHQATGALPVQALDGRRLRETRNESSSPELGGTGTRRQDSADGNIFNELRVNSSTLDETLEDANQNVCGSGILETALSGLGDGGAESSRDDNVVRVLFSKGCDALLAARPEMGGDLGETLLS